jgi:pimeloyl-ACP methyl ester carboxylesterase
MDKPPLFLIHGMWSTPHVWDWFAERYREQGHVVAAPALPYHDVDPAAPPSPLLSTIGVQDYVDALLAALRELPERPVIVGHSMGGMLAQKVAEAAGARGLVLLSPAPTASAQNLAVAPLRTVFGIATSKNWWKSPIKIDPERARWGIFNEVPAPVAEEEIGKLVWDSGRVLFQISMPWADKSRATRVDYSRLDMPALVVVGDRDRITPIATARATARNLTGTVDYREVSGAGHWLFHDPVRDRVAAEIDRFLDSLDD